MLEAVVSIINSAALVIGYSFLFLLGLIITVHFFWPVVSYGLWKDRSDEAKQIGAQIQKKHGYDSGASAWIADMIMEGIEEELIDSHMKYEPQPIGHLDVSLDKPAATELNIVRSALEDAGYYVHPFPREREGEWSKEIFGIWKTEPRWYVDVLPEDSDEVERKRVTTSLTPWRRGEDARS